jgi:hypothetical protein
MSISNNLMLAILAMDSYNRGYDAGIDLPADRANVGNAVVGRGTDVAAEPQAASASFYAQSYSWNGQIVISYRGTDSLPTVLGGRENASCGMC